MEHGAQIVEIADRKTALEEVGGVVRFDDFHSSSRTRHLGRGSAAEEQKSPTQSMNPMVYK